MIFSTEDTTASTKTTWETVGFVIKNNIVGKTEDTRSGKYSIIWMSEGKKSEEVDGKITNVYFEFKTDKIRQKLNCKDGETIYLNGIFRVLKNGKPIDNKLYYKYQGEGGISTAQSWRNPYDFWDRFNIPVTYESPDQAVKVEFRMADTNLKIADDIELGEYKVGSQCDLDANNAKIGSKNKGIHIPKSISFGGKDYLIYRHYYYDNDKPSKKFVDKKVSIYDKNYKSKIQSLQSIQAEVTDHGTTIVYMFKSKSTEQEDSEHTESISESLEIPEPTGVIGADDRGNEAFTVEDGIPTTEHLYSNVFTSQFLTTYKFTRTFGTKYYTVNVTRNFILTWDEESKDGRKKEKSKTVPLSMSYQIPREYSYWELKRLGVYGLDMANVENYALPNGKAILTPYNYMPPTVVCSYSNAENDHIIEPKPKDVKLEDISINGGDQEPSIDDSYVSGWEALAKKEVKQILVKNDNLTINGITIMTNVKKEKKTDDPKDMPSGSDEIGENVLYLSNLAIDQNKTNGTYHSKGTVGYKAVTHINVKEANNLNYPIEDINDVVIHTPTVCDAYIENCDSYNQMISPDRTRFSLILGTRFSVQLLTTGQHRFINGYDYRDYAKYIAARQVCLPFDVYNGSSFIRANTWVDMSDIETFYLPTWVEEGKYTIQFRSISLNAEANGGMDRTQYLANTEIDNYVACDSIDVEVSGRIYGLNIYDISDYPTWQNVFRKNNSMQLTGFRYTVGTKNQDENSNGNQEKYTLPLINGSHPKYKNIGTLKTGYAVRFMLTTVGNMYGYNDYIRIKPTFYYVDYLGRNKKEVDVYYSESFLNNKHVMVKMGSELDKTNIKRLSLGEPYLSVPRKEIGDTATLLNILESKLLSLYRNVYTFTNIMIPENLRTFVGNENMLPSRSMPYEIEEKMLTQSVQNWYCEYYIPSEIHILPKDFNLTRYITENGPIDFKEDFWLENGYLLINFDIETIQNNERHLSYINKENAKFGYCNMWNREGYLYKKKDYKNNEFDFEDGDFVLYDVNKSAAKDYISSGTH
ncbi:DUF5704 domain-containing protein [Anaeromicropila herbilytica]|uniref:DUF5704 domain-containing protein n=1 Tax=Anaeromicropila herbilytica TaxID=2785025 RepID=A0A7R7EJF9_9FIRM|nr:DUF5704 domain-containing protein [Anaeromicropila herbilytica]BCN30250.1 hypothetical protein bsdtb5_15450 [Anaeromicropila herbilytica]